MSKLILMIILLCFSSASVFQIYKILKYKSAKDLSFKNWLITEFKILFMMILSVMEGAYYLVITNSYSLIMNAILLILIIRFGNYE